MIKLIIGLFAGMVLMGVFFLGPLSPASASGQTDKPNQPVSRSAIAAMFRESTLLPLQKAGDGIRDADNKQFYGKLVGSYHLDSPGTTASQEEISLSELLPDIKSIHNSALSLPLIEAGKNIKDKDIARFYYDFLKRAGWMIEND